MLRKPWFNPDEEALIVEAIQLAEKLTSGEIRVHIHRHPDPDAMKEAVAVFHRIGMDKTEGRNGVLFFLMPESRQFAILGDIAIDKKVPVGFWDTIKCEMEDHFRAGHFVKGLVHGITKAGAQLQHHFPYQRNDINELPDSVSYDA